jgi:hypothetical protein
MKKTIIIVLAVLFLVTCWAEQGHIKNFIGSNLGYANCPNCGDSWWWKKDAILWFSSKSGVLICKVCLSKPKQLNEKRIAENLQKYKWPDEEIVVVQEVVRQLKAR